MAELSKSITPIEMRDRGRSTAWGPLREPLFRSLWIASVISYTGTWMQNVGTGWLMTNLTLSPLMVGLVQAAQSLPVFLVILPAGALADIVDRRRFLIFTQTWMVVAAAALGVMTIAGVMTPWILLAFTFLMGLGAVVNDPPWQAITPDIVSPPQLASGIALNSAGYNVARAVGPALGGLVIAAAGSGIAFLINAASFFGVIFFLLRWKNVHDASLPRERMRGAMKTGLQYVKDSRAVQAVLVRTGVFSLSASALLAMLPLIARPFGSTGYGAMLGFFGLGALGGAAALPALRRMMSIDALVAGATVVFALATFASGWVGTFWVLSVVLFAAGVAWIFIVASLNVSAQTMCPNWVRARALSIYLLVLQGGMAAGSALWGELANRYGMAEAMAAAAVGLLLGLITARTHRLHAEGLGTTAPVSG
ncbi:MAG TPA: MFS transporter [Terriglobales bacterium]|nr:MFS transporter [Terriglobales bacterium]